MFAKAFFSAAVACGLLASSVNAHMVITSPVPYGQDTLNNSPLEADGSDFPCKQRSGVYDVTKMNSMPVGVPQKLAFKGGATHGGGSCQISVTMDKEPTKDSQWKVIDSILGGCPNPDAGNANGAPTYDNNPTFEFSMPKGMPNGQYTLAWTWFNKIGNREMYMNCAPIDVTGGADNKDVFNSLPDMFVANIGNGCTTSESQDFVFPQCGKYVETFKSTALGSSTTGTCATAAAGGSSGSGSDSGSVSSPAAAPTGYGSGSSSSASAPSYGGSDSGATSAAAAPSYAAPTEAASAPGESAQGSGGEIATVTTMATVTASGYGPPAGAAQPTGGAAAPAYGSSGSSSGTSGSDAGTGSNGTSSSGSCSGGGVACDNDGSVVCIGSSQWGMCNAGCAVPMALADGTSCSGGVIAKREMMNHLRRHIAHAAHKF